jgi:hypothetical protein
MIDYDPNSRHWKITGQPHVLMRAKRIWPELNRQYGTLTLSTTIPNAVDLRWFLDRYALPLTPDAKTILNALLRAARARQEAASVALSLTDAGTPVNMAVELRSYQVQAFELTRALGSLLLGDEMGLGKTAVGIALCAAVPGFTVVICQNHVQYQWKAQFAKFAPLLNVEIAKTTKPETVNSKVLIMPYSKAAGWAEYLTGRVTVLVLDECQELRRDGSAKYEAVKAIAAARPVTIGLSGTPVYNYGGEMFNIMEVITPDALGERREFISAWCDWNGKHMIIKEPEAFGSFLAENKLMLRRTKAEVKRELPAVQRLAHTVEYDPKIMQKMTADANQLARKILGTASFNEKGVASRQLSIKLRQSTGIAKAPYVAEFVAELAKDGQKVVLAGWHREVYLIWQRIFKEQGVRAVLYTGSESDKQKNEAVKFFTEHDGGAVFIISLRSGAGLDGLQHVCNTVVAGELDWSPQVHEQIITRVHRDGQQDGCTAIYLVSEAGSDPVIAGILGVKRAQGHGILDPLIPIPADAIAKDFNPDPDSFGASDTNRATALATAWLAQQKEK